MKKLFFYLSAVLLSVAAVSCQKEIGVATPGDGNVTFTVVAPGAATKALIGDGENVNVVYYEVYKAEDNHKNSINGGEPLIDGIMAMENKQAVLNLNLLKDQDYVALFWAQVDGVECYDVEDLRNVQVSYLDKDGEYALANDEDRAAFCQVHKFSTNKAYNKTVELVRPFAQINLGTTKESLDIDYHIELEQSKVKLTGVGTTYNVASKMTGDEAVEVVLDFANVPDQMLQVGEDVYAYAGMNYVLVPNNIANIGVEYDIMTDMGTIHRNVGEVPAKKNYRTNLLGNLLTYEVAITIVVDEEFAGDENVTFKTTSADIAAAEAGSTIYLADNIEIAFPSTIADGVTVIGTEGTVFTGKTSISGDNVTIKNVEFRNVDDVALTGGLKNVTFVDCVFNGKNALRWCYANGDIVFEGCTFGSEDCTRGVHFDAGEGTASFYGCTLYGFQAFGSSMEKITFTECSFPMNNSNNVVNMYSVFEYNDCTFNPEMHCDCAGNGVVASFKGCSYTDGSDIYGLVRFDKDPSTCTISFDGEEISFFVPETIELNDETLYIKNATVSAPVTVKGNGTLSLENVTINVATGNGLTFAEGSDVVLTGKNLVVETANGTAIAGSEINIVDFDGLTAKGGDKNGYGIGGSAESVVNILNSTIDYACGGFVQPLFINDTKYGKSEPEGAPAIGGAKISITSSTITKVDGGSKAAAIGARYHSNTEVVIKNSEILEANGGNASAGIGGSRYSGNIAADAKQISKVKIENSTVVANGGQFGAGIGSGYDTHCAASDNNAVNEIVIINSNVTAKGGQYAAGIGTGFHAAALTGSIDAESTVVAISGDTFYKDTYTLAQNVGYGIVDPAREYVNAVVTFTVAGQVIAAPVE